MRINPYRPAYPVLPDNFAGRETAVNSIIRGFEYTKIGQSTNFAILGDWGIGKTALLRKVENIAKDNYNAITTIIDVHSGMDSNAVLKHIMNKLINEIRREMPTLTFKTNVADIREKAVAGIIKKIAEDDGDINFLFESLFDALWGVLSSTNKIVVVMVDNLEFLDKDPRTQLIETIRNVFQSFASNGNKTMILLSGKEIFFEQTSSLYSPTIRFFQRIKLDRFTLDESRDAIMLPIKGNENFEISENAAQEIHRLSDGHPYILKSLCHICFELNHDGKVDKKWIETNMPEIIDTLGRDLFITMYDQATDEEKKVLKVISKIRTNVVRSKLIDKQAAVSSIGPHLSRLVEKGHLIRPERGKYSIFHPLFKEFLKTI